MKTKKMMTLTLLLIPFLCPDAQAFYKPSTGMWISRDPIGEVGFELARNQTLGDTSGLSMHERNTYLFLNNDQINKIDYLGLKQTNWQKIIDAAVAAADAARSAATPGGEYEAALKVFGACNSLGLGLAWARTQYNDCLRSAITGPANKSAAAEKACKDKWEPIITLLTETYNKECKCEK